jgi:hypothetical protein
VAIYNTGEPAPLRRGVEEPQVKKYHQYNLRILLLIT